MSAFSTNPNMATMTKTIGESRLRLIRLNYNFPLNTARPAEFGQQLRALLE